MKTDYHKLDTQLLINMMYSRNVIHKCAAICEVTRRNIHSSQAISILNALKSDESIFWNDYKTQDFAIAALDILKIKPYRGEKREVKRLIESQLCF